MYVCTCNKCYNRLFTFSLAHLPNKYSKRNKNTKKKSKNYMCTKAHQCFYIICLFHLYIIPEIFTDFQYYNHGFDCFSELDLNTYITLLYLLPYFSSTYAISVCDSISLNFGECTLAVEWGKEKESVKAVAWTSC